MTLDIMIMFVGASVALLPFLGIPRTIDEFIFTILGLVVIALGVTLRRKRAEVAREERLKNSRDHNATR